MGLIAANKRFLWAGVGAPGSMHDSTILQSSDIFNSIQEGQVLPYQVLKLPGYGEILLQQLEIQVLLITARGLPGVVNLLPGVVNLLPGINDITVECH